MSREREPRLGGMALANGLLVHGPTHWAAAIREPDGSVRVASGPKPRFARGALAEVPVLRGVLRMAEAMAVIPAARRGTPGARLPMERLPVAAAVAASAAATVLARRHVRSIIGQELASTVAGLAPALVALRASDAAMWHGVEHKSIAAYEDGGAAELARAANHPKEHRRCGSNLVLPLMGASILVNTALRTVVPRPTMAMRLGAAAVSLGAAVELFSFAMRRPSNPVSRAVHGVGHFMQARFATIEPAAADMSVGQAAMEEILRLEGGATTQP